MERWAVITVVVLSVIAIVFSIIAIILIFQWRKEQIENAVPVVPQVDLSRYQGRWYEIESIPQPFERGCKNVTADYTLQQDGTVRVENTCVRGDKVVKAIGKALPGKGAEIIPGTTLLEPGKLKVTFFEPFYGKYWIFDLDENYQYALIGSPNKNSLWILSREKTLDQSTIDILTNRAQELGFDTSRLVPMVQE